MTRDEFIELLARTVAEGWLSEDQATTLLQQFDADELIVGYLPLGLNRAINDFDMDRAQLYVAKAGVLLLGATKAQQVELLQDWFIVEARTLAPLATTNVAGWQVGMRELIRAYLIQQTQMGLGRAIGPGEAEALFQTINEQLAYLSRFADEVAIRQLLEDALSELQIGARSELYGGMGRALWYQAEEATIADGWVVDYVSQDDKGVCDACVAADQASPYLPGSGPYPGSICFGKSRCRCRRVARYAPEAAARLRGLIKE